MARVTGPFFSLDARGTIAQTLTASFWRGINYMRARVIPHNPNSTGQQAIRQVLSDGVSKWRFGVIPSASQAQWNTYAKGLGESGFNRFMRKYIAENYADEAVVSPQSHPTPS